MSNLTKKTELIKITEKDGEHLVSARELHAFLESKRDFSNWIKDRISKYGFIENQDYTTFNKIVERAKRVEYALTLDTAKEISMVEGNSKGQEARRYFIACEKVAMSSTPKLPTVKELAEMVIKAETEKEELLKVVAKQQPMVEYTRKVINSNETLTITQVADGLNLSAKKLNQILCEMKVQYQQSGMYHLFSKYKGKGYATTRTSLEGHESLVWTQRGKAFIHLLINPAIMTPTLPTGVQLALTN